MPSNELLKIAERLIIEDCSPRVTEAALDLVEYGVRIGEIRASEAHMLILRSEATPSA